uniref:Putative WRKY transcription factor 53 n=1 Tax=Lilium longiflorum TaxID=4690 RepID=A0A6G8D9H3_LILLO|nr:putative WRKY transcription factor 53 [Lilium longiflorum]
MENEENPLVLELSRFQELFKAYLRQPSSSESLIMEMQSSLDKSMSLARTSVPAAQQPTSPSDVGARLTTKKRRTMAKTIGQRVMVQVAGVGVDGQLGDGHNWRKYGQKNIQYAKYPRCYYRCSYSETRNCPARKQVQQSDENLSAFEITYIQTHTCYPSEAHNCPAEKQVQQSDENLSTFEDTYIQTHTCYPPPQQNIPNINTEVSSSDLASPSLLFPTTPEIWLDSSEIDNCFMGNFSPSPISAEMSAPNYFSVSEWDMREGPSLQAKGSNSDNIWEENSAAISPFLGMDMDSMLNPGELDPCSQFS